MTQKNYAIVKILAKHLLTVIHQICTLQGTSVVMLKTFQIVTKKISSNLLHILMTVQYENSLEKKFQIHAMMVSTTN